MHEQEYTETQTGPTNVKGGSKENQTWSVTLIGKCMWKMVMFISVRLSNHELC